MKKAIKKIIDRIFDKSGNIEDKDIDELLNEKPDYTKDAGGYFRVDKERKWL